MDFQERKIQIQNGNWTIFLDLCKGCGLCVERCPFGALAFSSEDLGIYSAPAVKVDPAKCTLCQICEQICPDCALRVDPAERGKKNV